MDPLTAAVTGFGLGLAGGLAPGPITVLVISQTLRHGPAEGAKVAVAPVLTDGPLLLASAAFATALGETDMALGLIGVVGALVLFWLGRDCMRTEELTVDEDTEAGSLRKAFLTNLTNPHPYVFWIGVGGPLAARAWSSAYEAALAFVLAFFAALCGSKLILAWMVGRARDMLTGPAYRWTMRGLGVSLWGLAAWIGWDALQRLTAL
jgi:threonine/homoserine/homoserine lactone efflux protein